MILRGLLTSAGYEPIVAVTGEGGVQKTSGLEENKGQGEKRLENGFRTVATAGAVQIVAPGAPSLGFGGRNS